MHKWVYNKADALIDEIDTIGCDNMTDEQIEKAYYISKVLKNIICVDKEYHIVDAMEKSTTEDNMAMIEKYRDMDRETHNKMYYTEPVSRYESAKMHYTELKEIHKANSPEDKKIKSQEVDKWLNIVKSDVMELLADMTPEERTVAKNKLINLGNSL